MTSKTVLFHVGLPKAASTFLQRRLFPALDAAFLNVQVHPRPEAPSLLRRGSTAFLHCADEARAAINAAGQDVIVSSECFVLGTTAEQLFDYKKRAECLREIWPSAKILVVLRRQDDFCRSLYVNTLKKAYPYPPARLLGLEAGGDPEDGRSYPYTILDLDRIVATYENLFGAENVLTIPFELLKDEPSNFIEAITDFGNLRLKSDVSMAVENRGLSLAGYAAARILNWTCFFERKSGQHALTWLVSRGTKSRNWRRVQRVVTTANAAQKRFIRYIVLKSNRLSRQSPRALSSGQVERIMRYHAASNRALSERRGLALYRYGYF